MKNYQRYLQGDDNAIVEIVRTYKDGLILYLNGYVNNIYIAEELCEDTFFRLMIKKPRYIGNYSFKSWLYRIGRNIAIDYIRHHRKELLLPIEDMIQYQADIESYKILYLKEERKKVVHNALLHLSRDYHVILWLIYFEGFSNQEASIAMKKNERQIRNLLYRAKQALKKQLEEEGFTYEKL